MNASLGNPLTVLARSQPLAAASAAVDRNQYLDSTGATLTSNSRDGAHDFDFLFGQWRIDNQRLQQRLVGCADWEQFEAIGECAPILGGIGNMDSFESDWGGDFRGMTLRLFDLKSRQWSLYWASNRSGVLEAPVVGAFQNGIGRFEGVGEHEGKPVLARFIWSHITPTSARWEQALSADGGNTWETNWRMQMTRIRQPQ